MREPTPDMQSLVKIKRIYEEPDPRDGKRILVDRLWPRGVSKASACLDHWMKEVAPSPELRTWFCHDPERFAEFTVAYELELAQDPVHREKVAELRKWAKEGGITLLYAAKDEKVNHATVLQHVVLEGIF